jgi:hypothetical protein
MRDEFPQHNADTVSPIDQRQYFQAARLNRQWCISNLQQLFAEILSGEKTFQGARRILKTDNDIILLHQFALLLQSTRGLDSLGKRDT